MAKVKRPARPDRTKKYVHHDNAICITLYNPSGGSLPEGIADIAADRLLDLAVENRLLIGIATT